MTVHGIKLPSLPILPQGHGTEAESPPWYHLIDGSPPLVFLVAGSRLFAADPAYFDTLKAGEAGALEELSRQASGPSVALEEHTILRAPNALTLNVAQACNLACSYCYANEGRFGGPSTLMSIETATTAVRRFIAEAPGPRVTLGFIGGEPFLNRPALHASVLAARVSAAERGLALGLSVTTNATLLNVDDLAFLREHAFNISVSMDGDRAVNDRHRRSRSGRSSADAALIAVRPLLESPGSCKIAARATIARDDLRVLERIEALASWGFRDIGVSPLRSSPAPDLALRETDWAVYLQEMIRAAEHERARLQAHAAPRFGNLLIALRQIHAGHARPLPCGAASTYVSVSAQGHYFTCHRTIDNPAFALGDKTRGPLEERRRQFILQRQVDRQEPCRCCWARYLCGGGCHAEVSAVGRSGCDFIRGWLEYCLSFYHWTIAHADRLLGSEIEA